MCIRDRTPAASILVKRHGLDAGAVVSASHNRFSDNGIKFFSPRGTKLDDETEAEIERLIEAPAAAKGVGRVRELQGSLEDYLRELTRASRSTSAAQRSAWTAQTEQPTAPRRRSSNGWGRRL